MTTWTHFWDMHSGGGSKEPQNHIFIEAPEREAVSVFFSRFGHNPNRVTCTCCGEDYAISEYPSLEAATAYQRGCRWSDEADGYVEEPDNRLYAKKYVTTAEYLTSKDVLVVRADDIAAAERDVQPPQSGYVWIGD